MSATPTTTYRSLLAYREFRTLLWARALVVAGFSVSFLALGTITYAATGSPALTTLAMFGGPLVQLVANVFLGAAPDLLRPRRAINLAGLAMAVAALLQAIPALAWPWRFVILALPYVVIAATAGSVFALAADILPGEAFVLGRSMLNMVNGIMQIVGYAVGGLLILRFSPTSLFLLAACVQVVAVLVVRFGVGDHPPRAAGEAVVARTRRVNVRLLSSPVTRPILLAAWVPGGFAAGCEALFVPYSPTHAGLLFASTAAGMFLGDVVVGRFLAALTRDRLTAVLLALTCVPYLAFVGAPALPTACALGFVAAVGYASQLPLQDRMVRTVTGEIRGQAFGLYSTGVQVGIATGSVLAGVLAQVFGSGHADVGRASAVIAGLGLLSLLGLVPGLRRSRLADAPTV